MMTDRAARGRAQDTMVTGDMTGDTANHGTLETAFGIGRHCRAGKRERQGRAYQKNFHRWTSSLLCLSQSAGFVFVPGPNDARTTLECCSAAGQRFFSASDLARIFAIVVVGVMASPSMARRMIAGLPEACACLNASGKSSVRSTETPKPPKARA
jgi:hypothetical protein